MSVSRAHCDNFPAIFPDTCAQIKRYIHAYTCIDIRVQFFVHARNCSTYQGHTATHCNTLQYTATHRNTLQHTVTCNSWYVHAIVLHINTRTLCVAQCVAADQYISAFLHVYHLTRVCCTVLHCVAACCSRLQCDAVYCSILQCVAVCPYLSKYIISHVTVCCSVLQCVAVCCSVLQCIAVYCSVSYLSRYIISHVALCCSVLQ